MATMHVLEHEICSKPLNSRSLKSLRKELFKHVAENLTPNVWKHFGRELLHTVPTAESIISTTDYQYNDCIEKYTQLLLTWNRRLPQKATVKNLYRALNKAHVRLIGDDMLPIVANYIGQELVSESDTSDKDEDRNDAAQPNQDTEVCCQNENESSVRQRKQHPAKHDHKNSKPSQTELDENSSHSLQTDNNASNSIGELHTNSIETSQNTNVEENGTWLTWLCNTFSVYFPSKKRMAWSAAAITLLFAIYGIDGIHQCALGAADYIRSQPIPRYLGFLLAKIFFWF